MPSIRRRRSCRSARVHSLISCRRAMAWTLIGTRYTPDCPGCDIVVLEKSFLEALLFDPANVTVLTCFGAVFDSTFQASGWHHTKLQLILQLEHTKRGAKAPLFLSPPHDFPDCDPPRKTRLICSPQKCQGRRGFFVPEHHKIDYVEFSSPDPDATVVASAFGWQFEDLGIISLSTAQVWMVASIVQIRSAVSAVAGRLWCFTVSTLRPARDLCASMAPPS